jgi:hypothetical protein
MIRQTKEKKIPIKGLRTTKEQKPLKQTCIGCAKVKAIANKTKKLCATCVSTEKKEKQKLRKEHKKKVKQDTITQNKLDQITSWLIRSAYPMQGPHCSVKLEYKTSQCGHFVGRTKQSTRYSLKNLVAIDKTCNFYRPEHPYSLGKFLNKLWGEGTADEQILLSNKKLKLSNEDRRLIYNIYKNALSKLNEFMSQEEKYEILKEAQEEYEKVVFPLLF